MTIKETIRKAIEGGYDHDFTFLMDISDWERCKVWGDPEFWQSLERALGVKAGDDWRRMWHLFIDHLVDGKTIESFFEQFNPPPTP